MDKITEIILEHYRRTATKCRTCGTLNCVILAHDNQAKPPKGKRDTGPKPRNLAVMREPHEVPWDTGSHRETGGKND